MKKNKWNMIKREQCILRCFYEYSRDFTTFTVHATKFGQLKSAWGNSSLHVGPSEKGRYLTLDLLKSFFLWTDRRKATINERLNL